MFNSFLQRFCIVGAFSCGIAAGLDASRAAVSTIGGGDSAPSTMPTTMGADVPAPANLMSLLDNMGVGKKLEDWNLDISGHVEGGYTYQFLKPNDHLYGRSYDFVSNRAILNQAAINFERSLDVSTDHFDIGFRVQALEGTDAGLMESFQKFTPLSESAAVFDVGGNNSAYQFDLPDFYVDFGIPLGRGVRVRAGRFEFFKPIDPNNRIFYSTTFVYTNVLAFTNTGVTVAYDFTDHAGIELGFSRGENITVTDSNGSIDFIGKAHVDVSEKTALIATCSVGPELAHDSHDYTVLIDISGTHRVNDQLSFVFDGIYAHQFGNSTTSDGYSGFNYPVNGQPYGFYMLPASYYGASGNVIYQVNPYFSLAGRLEWFRDDGGILTPTHASQSLYEVTVGSTITPFPQNALGQNIKLRPEVRWDHSNRDFFGPNTTGGFTRKDQLTFGADVIYNF